MAGVVMLFHSPMSRMNRTLPDAVEGESDPKTASWRAHHGAITRTKSADAGDRRPERDGRGAATGRRARRASGPRRRPGRAPPGRAGRRCGKGSPARPAGRRPRTARPEPFRPRAAIHREPSDQRLVEREVVGLDEVDRGEQRDRDQDPGADGAPGARPASRAIAQVSGAASEPMSANGAAEAQATSPKTRQERDLDHRRQRHPVRVRGDRQDRIGRDLAADLGEDPDEVDVEARDRRGGARATST